jgi:hypothetical protein
MIKKCLHKFMIVPLTIAHFLGDSHANVLIINFQEFAISRFEPLGIDVLKSVKMDSELETYFKGINPKWRYFGTHGLCEKNALQSLQIKEKIRVPNDPGGWCQAWSLYFIHMRLLHPSIGRIRLIREIRRFLNKEKYENRIPSLTEFIAAYAKALNTISLAFLVRHPKDLKIFRNKERLNTLVEENLGLMFGYLRFVSQRKLETQRAAHLAKVERERNRATIDRQKLLRGFSNRNPLKK